MIVKISFGTDRARAGLLYVMNNAGKVIFGPLAVGGCADQHSASSNGNPHRNPTQFYGDTPTGEYRVTAVMRANEIDGYDYPAYGENGVIFLEPTGGQAAAARAMGRTRFLLHGGRTSAAGLLCATSGALRVYDSAQHELMKIIQGDTVVRVDSISSSLGEYLDAEAPFEYPDPPLIDFRGMRFPATSPALASVPASLGNVVFTGSPAAVQAISSTAYTANPEGERRSNEVTEYSTAFVCRYRSSQQLTAYSAVEIQTLTPGLSHKRRVSSKWV